MGKKRATKKLDSNFANLLYPILPLGDSANLLLHNLVMQLFTACFIIATIFIAKKKTKYFNISKIITGTFAGIAAIITGIIMVQGRKKAEKTRQSMALLNMVVATFAILTGISSIIAQPVFGLLFLFDITGIGTNLFWLWRNVEVAITC